MSTIKKYTDWGAWFDGLRTNVMKAGATSIVTNLTVFMSSNTASAMGIPGMIGAGENWKTLVSGLLAQFVLHVVYAAALYTQANQPQAVIETIDTSSVTKNPETGAVTVSASTTTKTTPAPLQENSGQKPVTGDSVASVEVKPPQ